MPRSDHDASGGGLTLEIADVLGCTFIAPRIAGICPAQARRRAIGCAMSSFEEQELKKLEDALSGLTPRPGAVRPRRPALRGRPAFGASQLLWLWSTVVMTSVAGLLGFVGPGGAPRCSPRFIAWIPAPRPDAPLQQRRRRRRLRPLRPRPMTSATCRRPGPRSLSATPYARVFRLVRQRGDVLQRIQTM